MKRSTARGQTTLGPKGCRPRKFGIVAFVTLGALVTASGGHAEDAALMAALRNSACSPKQIRLAEEVGDARVFHVSCTGKPTRAVTVICRKSRCDLSDATLPQNGTERD